MGHLYTYHHITQLPFSCDLEKKQSRTLTRLPADEREPPHTHTPHTQTFFVFTHSSFLNQECNEWLPPGQILKAKTTVPNTAVPLVAIWLWLQKRVSYVEDSVLQK